MKSPALALALGATFIVSLDSTALVAAFPALREHFVANSPAAVSWALNAYTLVYAALLVPLGRWGDHHGRRRAFLAGAALFALASLACALAPGLASLVAARAAQALGAALLTPAALALGLQSLPAPRRAAVLGLVGATGALAAAAGPVLGSCLIELSSWRAVFLLHLPACAWLIRLALRLPADAPASRPAPATDWTGSLMLIAAVASLVLAGLHVDRPEHAAAALALLGAALLAAYVLHARRHPAPALDLRLFADRNYRFANLGALVFGAAFGLMFFSSFLFLTGVWGYAQGRAGLAAAVGPLLVVPFALLGGRWAARRGHRPVLVAGGALFALGQLWYRLRLESAADYLGVWLPGQLATGAAVGLVLPALAGAAAAGLPDHALGSGNAVHSALRQLATVFGVALGVALVGAPGAATPRFLQAHALLAFAGLLTALLAWPLRTAAPRA